VNHRELDEFLSQIRIGDREGGPVLIAAYDETWPARFEEQRARIKRAVGEAALRIDHIGSTAVPGLAAKPIIDVQVSSVTSTRTPSTSRPWKRRGTSSGFERRVIAFCGRRPATFMYTCGLPQAGTSAVIFSFATG
jgi:GrpB-like predicted nucleotidyltransferase (UPF0157 family)